MNRAALRALCVLTSFSAAAFGHHSGADGEPIRLDGVVTEVRMINPHAQILVAVADEAGKVSTWRVVAAPPVELRNLGWTAETLPVGVRVRITGRPAGLGDRVVDLDLVEFEDGRVLAASLPLRLQPGF
ncbi:MAG TPA: DUF6152 family protein [Gammaproteobacteria bacterium]